MILQDLALRLSALYPGVSFYSNWPSDFSYVLYLKQKPQGQGWKSSIYIYDIVLILPSNSNTDAFTNSGSAQCWKKCSLSDHANTSFYIGENKGQSYIDIVKSSISLVLNIKIVFSLVK